MALGDVTSDEEGWPRGLVVGWQFADPPRMSPAQPRWRDTVPDKGTAANRRCVRSPSEADRVQPSSHQGEDSHGRRQSSSPSVRWTQAAL